MSDDIRTRGNKSKQNMKLRFNEPRGFDEQRKGSKSQIV